MVLYKRKPITMIPPPTNVAESAEVWVMKGTEEVFTDYEKYLKRLDYLTQKKFVDAVNGRSGLTFFDALESETKSSNAIENVFPEVLKDPILRKVQFSTISRVDDLVNAVYDEFKKDFFPGEDVIVIFDDGEQNDGTIREKAKFPMIRGPDGSVQRAAFSRYFVRLHSDTTLEDQEALVDDKHIRRDKKMFTKQNLRAFLKNSLQREAWIGAPWLVKEHLAIQYRLPMEIPSHLLQDARLLANKVHTNSHFVQYLRIFVSDVHANVMQQQMLQIRPPKGRRSNGKTTGADDLGRQNEEMALRQQQQHPGAGPQQFPNYLQPIASRVEARPLPPPVIKYPIEDLDLPPKSNGVTRPELKFFTPEMVEYIRSSRTTTFTDIDMRSMGMLLEVWNTLNVQCEVYCLDSFTFDDFVDAMQYSSINPPCELLDEIHCAVLALLVDEKGKIQTGKGMLDVIVETEESSEDPREASELSTPQPDVPARSTRSRLSHVAPGVENPRSPTVLTLEHRALEMLGERSWKDRLAARDFENGGWQVILVGLLHQLSHNPAFKARCERILAELAPIELEPTQATAQAQFAKMNINLRISALQTISILSVGTPAVKEFMEHCSEDMTEVRKRKIDHQRAKKICMEELQMKDRERKILWPANMPDSPKQESVGPVSLNGEGDDTLETNGAASSDPEDEAPTSGRSLRRGNDRKRKREEEAARRDREKAEKAAAAKEHSKQSKEFKKILHDIEELKKQIMNHEENILECDADLREANVQRTKVLGKDRFCNRYYWFERNGQPFGGLPTSSTAAYGYANGRIWVQGPDEMEAEGFIDRTAEEQREYQARFRMTVPERRRHEEGSTILRTANEWGFYDDPDRLDNLIGWLDDRGERERALRKELCNWRDVIVQYMEAYKNFKDQEAAKKLEADEEHATRIATRHKTQEEQTAARERCLKWTNTMAKDERGHLHSRPPPPPKNKKLKLEVRQPKGVGAILNRNGKPVTRQGIKDTKAAATVPKHSRSSNRQSKKPEARLYDYYVT